jgi:hypothetical protein
VLHDTHSSGPPVRLADLPILSNANSLLRSEKTPKFTNPPTLMLSVLFAWIAILSNALAIAVNFCSTQETHRLVCIFENIARVSHRSQGQPLKWWKYHRTLWYLEHRPSEQRMQRTTAQKQKQEKTKGTFRSKKGLKKRVMNITKFWEPSRGQVLKSQAVLRLRYILYISSL